MNNKPLQKISDLSDSAFEGIPDMFVLFDRDTTLLDIRHAIADLVGGEAIGIIGRKLAEMPRDEVSTVFLDRFEKVCGSGRCERFVFSFHDSRYEAVLCPLKGGHVLADIRPVYEQARVESELKETRESLLEVQTELKHKNLVLSSALKLAEVIPWTCDLNSRTFYCDYKFYHPEHAREPDEQGRYVVSMDTYFDSIHPDYREQAIRMIQELLDGQREEFHQTYRVHWYNDREWEWVSVQSGVGRRGSDGRPELLVGSARIVTAQKRMEESLREAKELADRSNLLKSAFVANMSHEIRTPLNAIVGFSELLSTAETEQERAEYLSIIRSSNDLLLQLIGDILDLSKIEAGIMEFTFAEHDLSVLMEELEQTTRMKVDNPAVKVSCTAPVKGCTIHTDRGRLLQVLHNFINNAAKFTHKGHIHFGCRKQADGRWYFFVEDTGCGIPADKVSLVFERFVKLDTKVKGTGLGLAISKSIVERLGGEIGVTSTVQRGSTFWFILPAGSIIAPLAEKQSARNAAATPEPTILLIAEDDPANYKLFEVMLKKQYKLLHAWNGREAVEMFREHNPAVILMDIKMPEMDGYEATAAIRKVSPTVPIVAVTAYASSEDMRRILSSGFDGCLPKPVSAENLKKKIAELESSAPPAGAE